jgi:hypothetical protein
MKRLSIATTLLTIAIPLVWLGMIAAISFVETPLKFTAPNVTLEIGVGIGQIVFSVLNKIEWVLFLLWLVSILFSRLTHVSFLVLFIILTALSIQTFLLLPQLNARIEMLQEGMALPRSPLHSYYIIAEIIKMLMLATAAYQSISSLLSKFIQTKTYTT